MRKFHLVQNTTEQFSRKISVQKKRKTIKKRKLKI